MLFIVHIGDKCILEATMDPRHKPLNGRSRGRSYGFFGPSGEKLYFIISSAIQISENKDIGSDLHLYFSNVDCSTHYLIIYNVRVCCVYLTSLRSPQPHCALTFSRLFAHIWHVPYSNVVPTLANSFR